MAENSSAQALGLFNIPLGDKKWFAEHTGHRHHHHHHHNDNSHHNNDSESGVRKVKESEPAPKS